MKLLVDMNLSPRWAAFLVAEGHDAVHWSSVGPPSAPDAEIMAHAATGGFVVLSHDLDFGTILAASGDATPSVVTIRADDLAIDSIGPAVVAALRQFEHELAVGALVLVQPHRTRARLLPLGDRSAQ